MIHMIVFSSIVNIVASGSRPAFGKLLLLAQFASPLLTHPSKFKSLPAPVQTNFNPALTIPFHTSNSSSSLGA